MPCTTTRIILSQSLLQLFARQIMTNSADKQILETSWILALSCKLQACKHANPETHPDLPLRPRRLSVPASYLRLHESTATPRDHKAQNVHASADTYTYSANNSLGGQPSPGHAPPRSIEAYDPKTMPIPHSSEIQQIPAPQDAISRTRQSPARV